MPLKSRLFKGDRALEACLIQDSAHLTLGTVGDHVPKIHTALLVLDKVSVAVNERKAKTYGPSTAAAVLAFKTRRKIINTSYQKTPDNIVGKMTIARLDNEIFAAEQRSSPNHIVCRGFNVPITASASLPESFLAMGARKGPVPVPVNPTKTFRSARARVIFQETEAAVQAGGSVHLIFSLFRKARELMVPWGLDFAGIASGEGIFPMIGPRIPDFEQVISGSEASCFSVRAAAERVFPGQPGVLRIIFCPFTEDKDNAFGVTEGGPCGDWYFPKFCLINVRKAVQDQGTVLHEMIHASYREKKVKHDSDPASVFAEPNSVSRSKLTLERANAIANGYFSSILEL